MRQIALVSIAVLVLMIGAQSAYVLASTSGIAMAVTSTCNEHCQFETKVAKESGVLRTLTIM
jgi:hypothetical protein